MIPGEFHEKSKKCELEIIFFKIESVAPAGTS